MCFEVSALVPPNAPNGKKRESDGNGESDDDLSMMDADGNDVKRSEYSVSFSPFSMFKALIVDFFEQNTRTVINIIHWHMFVNIFDVIYLYTGNHTSELGALNDALHDLLDGIQVNFQTYQE